jgi:hypothetical protein
LERLLEVERLSAAQASMITEQIAQDPVQPDQRHAEVIVKLFPMNIAPQSNP